MENVKEKRYSMTLIKDGKADLIQDYHKRYRDHSNEILVEEKILSSNPNTAWTSGNL